MQNSKSSLTKFFGLNCFIFLLLFVQNLYSQPYHDIVKAGAIELVELRTEFSKTFLDINGLNKAFICSIPIHELDKEKNWVDKASETIYGDDRTIAYKPSTQTYSRHFWVKLGYDRIFSEIARGYIRWDLGSIDDNVTITGASFSIYPLVPSHNNNVAFKVTEIYTDPNTSNNAQIYNNCENGSLYDYFEYDPPSIAALTLEDNPSLITEIQNQLVSNWVAVGLKNEVEEYANEQDFFLSFQTGVWLTVTYTEQLALTVKPQEDWFPSSNGEVSPQIFIEDNSETEIVYYDISVEKDKDWLNLTSYFGQTPGNFIIVVDPNNEGETRHATVTINATYPPGVLNTPVVIDVWQESNILPELAVSINEWDPNEMGDNTVFNVSNNAGGSEFYFYITEGMDWITLDNYNGTTPQDIEIIAAPNYKGVGRSGTITIVAPGIFKSPKSIDISQDPASLIVLPDNGIPGLQEYLSAGSIIVNTFNVSNSGNVPNLFLGAASQIFLKPGFRSSPSSGNKFRAYISSFGEDDNLPVVNKGNLNQKNINLAKNFSKDNQQENVPKSFELYQNYPNPFNPVSIIKFDIPQNTFVSLKIYNSLGQLVKTLTESFHNAGTYQYSFDGINLSSGIYFYVINTSDFFVTKKMLLLK